MNASPGAHQRGFLLITVVVVLAVLAAMALMLSTSTALDNALVARHTEGATLDNLAESGLVHAKWQLAQNDSCSGYTNLPSSVFGNHSYSAAITPTTDSPVSITATGILADGTTRTLSRTDVKVYQAPTTVTLQPGSTGIDTYLWDGAHSGKNFGATDFISMNNQSAERTALIKFNLSALPPDVVISSAVLELWVEGSAGVNNGVIDAHLVSRPWVEGEYDDQAPPAGGGATYQSYDGQTNWTSPGGDYESTVVASVTIPSQTPAWYSWDITDSAKSWHAGSVANDGLLLRASGGTVDKIRFSSSDNVTAGNRPKLTITYACECGATCTPLNTLPIAHWKLDETAGLTAVDSVGGHDGTLYSSPAWTIGIIDGGLELDGSNDYVRVSDSSELHLADGTIQAWINLDTTSGEQYLFHKGGSDKMFVLVKDGEITYETNGETISGFIQANQWYLVTVSFGSDGMKLYLDGNLVASSSKTDGMVNNNDDIYIGADSFASKALDGTIDDIRIHDRALSAAEILDLFTAAGGGGSGHYLDEFNAIAYNGDDGTYNWSNDWQEVSESDGPSSGILRVLSDARCTGSNCIRIGHSDIEDQPTKALVREADLSSATSATFSYDYAVQNVDNNGTVRVRISADGGSNWTSLATYTISSGSGSESFDISSHIASNTQIRIEITDKYSMYVFFDDVRIDVDGGGGGDGECIGTVSDDFDSGGYDGSTGSLGWSSPWIEFNDSGGATSGDERVQTDFSHVALRVRDNDGGGEGVEREANLAGYNSASLSFEHRRHNLDNLADYVAVEVSSNGGSSWSEVDRFVGPGSDDAYQSTSYNISAYISSNTRIRFVTSSTLGATDAVFFDNIAICVSN